MEYIGKFTPNKCNTSAWNTWKSCNSSNICNFLRVNRNLSPMFGKFPPKVCVYDFSSSFNLYSWIVQKKHIEERNFFGPIVILSYIVIIMNRLLDNLMFFSKMSSIFVNFVPKHCLNAWGYFPNVNIKHPVESKWSEDNPDCDYFHIYVTLGQYDAHRSWWYLNCFWPTNIVENTQIPLFLNCWIQEMDKIINPGRTKWIIKERHA